MTLWKLAPLILLLAPTSGNAAPEVRALLVPEVEATLSADISGRIIRLPVEEGDRVVRGALLVGFECAIPKARLTRAQAELAGAEKSVESNQKLSQLGSFSQLDLALLKSKRDEARAVVKEGAARVSQCTLRAPFAGRIVERKVNNHETVSQGQELLSLIDDTALRLKLFVPSPWLRWIKPGEPFTVQIGETAKRYQARVERIGARVDPVSQSIPLRATIEGDHPELLAGMSGEATFTLPETDQAAAPVAGVPHPPGR